MKFDRSVLAPAATLVTSIAGAVVLAGSLGAPALAADEPLAATPSAHGTAQARPVPPSAPVHP